MLFSYSVVAMAEASKTPEEKFIELAKQKSPKVLKFDVPCRVDSGGPMVSPVGIQAKIGVSATGKDQFAGFFPSPDDLFSALMDCHVKRSSDLWKMNVDYYKYEYDAANLADYRRSRAECVLKIGPPPAEWEGVEKRIDVDFKPYVAKSLRAPRKSIELAAPPAVAKPSKAVKRKGPETVVVSEPVFAPPKVKKPRVKPAEKHEGALMKEAKRIRAAQAKKREIKQLTPAEEAAVDRAHTMDSDEILTQIEEREPVSDEEGQLDE